MLAFYLAVFMIMTVLSGTSVYAADGDTLLGQDADARPVITLVYNQKYTKCGNTDIYSVDGDEDFDIQNDDKKDSLVYYWYRDRGNNILFSTGDLASEKKGATSLDKNFRKNIAPFFCCIMEKDFG